MAQGLAFEEHLALVTFDGHAFNGRKTTGQRNQQEVTRATAKDAVLPCWWTW